MRRRGALLAAGLAAVLFSSEAQATPLRVMALDQCADQYALALASDAELALSPRADDPDSWMRAEARGRRQVRPTLEAAVGFDPDVVIRYWGGEPRLLAALERRGTRVLTIDDAQDFDGVRANLRKVAAGLDEAARGEALIAGMDDRLARAAPGAAGSRGEALYLTPGGFTGGPDTLMGAILAAAGYLNLAAPGFGMVGVEAIALRPPRRFVLAFFDHVRSELHGPGRHPVVRRAARGRTAARLPAAALTCPAWFNADAALALAEGEGA